MECLFPHLAPRTGYDKGCRCDRCRAAKNQHYRDYLAANREAVNRRNRGYYAANREAGIQRNRQWRAANREAVNQYSREWSAANPIAASMRGRRNKQRYQSATKERATAHKTPWSADEDQVVIDWIGTTAHLAFRLGRTYEATKGRIANLRKKGLILARDQFRTN